MFCIYVLSVLANTEIAVYGVQCLTETCYSGQEGLGHFLPYEQLHYSVDLRHEVFALRCWTIHHNGEKKAPVLLGTVALLTICTLTVRCGQMCGSLLFLRVHLKT